MKKCPVMDSAFVTKESGPLCTSCPHRAQPPEPQITHFPGCWQDGPAHWGCAVEEIKRLTREQDEALMVAEGPSTLMNLARGYVERGFLAAQLEADKDGLLTKLCNADMGHEVIDEIREVLNSLPCPCGKTDHENTPPMMFPEWIMSIFKGQHQKAAKLVEALRLRMNYPNGPLSLFQIETMARAVLREWERK